jgi:flagellar biosynthesis protein FlhG
VRHKQNDRRSESHDKIIAAIGGGKGGVGKTLITTTLGVALAKSGKRTVLVDMDFAGANLHHAFGVLNPSLSLTDFFYRRETDLNNLLLRTNVENLNILIGPIGEMNLANLQYSFKRKLLRNLKKIDADVILLDLGAGAAFNQLDFFLFADIGIVIIIPEPHAILDGFNFIKLSICRRLYRLFLQDKQLASSLKPCLSRIVYKYPFNMKEVNEYVKKVRTDLYEHWRKVLKNFQPNIIVNMVENDKEYEECRSLQVAANEILGVKIKSFNFVGYNDALRKAMKKSRPDLLIDFSHKSSNDISSIIDNIFFNNNGKQPFGNKARRQPFNGVGGKDGTERNVICSIKCELWGKCKMQKGGQPCRIKLIGFLNNNDSRVYN